MGRSLVAAAKVNPLQLPIPHSQEIFPRITMRLTRLDPDAHPNEPRIAQTIQALIDMGIQVELGERTNDDTLLHSYSNPLLESTSTSPCSLTLYPILLIHTSPPLSRKLTLDSYLPKNT